MGLHFVPIKRECVEPVVHVGLFLSSSPSFFFLHRLLATITLHVRNHERFFFPHVYRAEIFGGDGETWLPALMVFPRVRRGAPSREIKIDVSICLSILPPIYLSIYLSICIYLHLSVDPPGYPFIYPRSLVHLRLSAGFDAPFRRYLRTRVAPRPDILRALNCTLEISHRLRRQGGKLLSNAKPC